MHSAIVGNIGTLHGLSHRALASVLQRVSLGTGCTRLVSEPAAPVCQREGVALPSDTAAIEYARRIIDNLRKDRRPEDPEATIVVKNTVGDVIYRFPGN